LSVADEHGDDTVLDGLLVSPMRILRGSARVGWRRCAHAPKAPHPGTTRYGVRMSVLACAWRVSAESSAVQASPIFTF